MDKHKSVQDLRQNFKQRVMVFLDRQQVDLLDKIGKDALFTRGTKLSRIKIKELDINGEGISSLEDLKKRIESKIGVKLKTVHY
jgi:hypothetical protein